MTGATNIYQILEQLDEIVKESIATNSNLGLFAYIYRRTTAEIASEIALGHFKDNNRLEAMDVAFANLYLDAYKAYHNKEKVSAVWAYAFDHATDSLSILQHIMLGMNAHINLDLGIATAKTMSGRQRRVSGGQGGRGGDIGCVDRRRSGAGTGAAGVAAFPARQCPADRQGPAAADRPAVQGAGGRRMISISSE
jgi:hypothetical protein